MLYAFIVGDVHSELIRNRNKDDFYAGVLQVIDTYRQLQRKNPKLRISEVEKFVAMEKRGELKTFLESK